MRKQNRRQVAGTAALVVASAVLTGCGDGADAGTENAGSDEVISINMYSQALPYFQDIVSGAEDAAKEAGWKSEVTFGKTDPQLQFNQIQNAVTRQPSGMIVAPVDQEALVSAFQSAKDAGVHTVTVADDVAEEGQDSTLAFVGLEYPELGAQKAQWIVDELGGEGTVAVIHGIRGLHFTEAQFEGAMDVFNDNPGIKVVDGPYAGEFSADAGLTAAENVLTANPDVDALYFDNDDIALGGILAAKARNISMDDIIIIGTDGGEPARDAVKAGDLDYTISLCGYATGKIAFEVIREMVENDEAPDGHLVPIPVLHYTADSASEADAKIAAGEC